MASLTLPSSAQIWGCLTHTKAPPPKKTPRPSFSGLTQSTDSLPSLSEGEIQGGGGGEEAEPPVPAVYPGRTGAGAAGRACCREGAGVGPTGSRTGRGLIRLPGLSWALIRLRPRSAPPACARGQPLLPPGRESVGTGCQASLRSGLAWAGMPGMHLTLRGPCRAGAGVGGTGRAAGSLSRRTGVLPCRIPGGTERMPPGPLAWLAF